MAKCNLVNIERKHILSYKYGVEALGNHKLRLIFPLRPTKSVSCLMNLNFFEFILISLL